MRKLSRFGVLILVTIFAATPMGSAQEKTKRSSKSARPAVAKASDVQQLRNAIAAQQQQLEQQRQQMDELRSELQRLLKIKSTTHA